MLTPEKIEQVFAERRKKFDAINENLDKALAENNKEDIKKYLNELVEAYRQPIKFN